MTPTLEHFARLVVLVKEPITIGITAHGLRRVVPIIGGALSGSKFSGNVLPAGADYQLIRDNGYTTLDARYVVQLDDGADLYCEQGRTVRRSRVMARITAGLPVNPDEVYFRTQPRFETASQKHEWLSRPIFLGAGSRVPDRVELDIFEVK
jgi:hypothetical protein